MSCSNSNASSSIFSFIMISSFYARSFFVGGVTPILSAELMVMEASAGDMYGSESILNGNFFIDLVINFVGLVVSLIGLTVALVNDKLLQDMP
ncbi:MAG: hypothetical protein LWW97_04575 [Deltaproteobacteria bacterium]|nr:hypothetical protein [Deltaproteobacteria bacterium]